MLQLPKGSFWEAMIVHIPRTGEVVQFILLSPQLVGNNGDAGLGLIDLQTLLI